jgi:DNA-binding transcriptional LysR family regulator
MDLQQLKVFVRVAQLGSFTRAAEQLGQAKGQTSQMVRALESRLGVRLLVRTTRSVRLTPEGEEFLGRSRELLDAAEQLAGLFRQNGQNLRGTVRIDMISELADELLIPHLPDFVGQHPELEISISTADHFVDVAQEGFDCVLRLGELSDSDLMVRSLGVTKMCNVASPQYLKARGIPKDLADLNGHQLIHYSPRLSSRTANWEWQSDQSEDAGKLHSQPMRCSLVVNGTRSMKSACLASLGLMQVPRFGVKSLIDSGQLIEVMPRYVGPPLPVSLLYPYRRHVPARVRVTLDWLQQIVCGMLT